MKLVQFEVAGQWSLSRRNYEKIACEKSKLFFIAVSTQLFRVLNDSVD